jgi:hypothetical protein
MVPTSADGTLTPTATTRFQRHIQHLLDYTYMKSPLISKGGASMETMAEQTYRKSSLGKSPTAAQRLVEQTYRKSSLGKSQSMKNLVKYTYHTPPVGNLSRITRIIHSAGFGPH